MLRGFAARVPLGWRLFGPLALALVVLAGIGGLAIWQMDDDDAWYEQVLQGELRASTLALQMRVEELKTHQALKNALLRGDDPAQLTGYVAGLEQHAGRVRDLRAQMETLTPSMTGEERVLLARFDAGWAAYLAAWPRALAAPGGPGGRDVGATEVVMDSRDDSLEVALTELARSLGQRRMDGIHTAIANSRATAQEISVLLAAAAALGLVIALLAARRAERTLKQRAVLAEAAKARALAQLAAGVAHDVNQSLGIITGYSEIAFNALSQVKPDLTRAREGLELVSRAAMDAGDTLGRRLRFSRTAPDSPCERVDAGELLAEVAKLTAPRWRDSAQSEGREITVEVATTGDTGLVGWPQRLREALTNLVLNAVDAMPRGGKIRLSARRLPSGVEIAVSDTGSGMTDEVRAHLFEPFYTTKGDRGTGLGLAVVQGIVEQHGGRVDVGSTPGQGTVFTMWFPLAPPEAPRPTPSARPAPIPPLRILAVDDDPALARLMALMLRAQGHEVKVTEAAEDALALLACERFDLVISDLGMGQGMNGWDLASEVRHRWPNTRFALATGWGTGVDDATARARGVEAVLAKPYRAADLRRIAAGV